ncbi:permease-like cell division protein FtsX [Candidatus Arthromitus sp. SFB-rat-Yit]|uniref:permease-like cell division protein FtsX n=1 Tax=Candidatus Arthromitus sp. SFB-rat-Yit TaxID=1041504 RepID=UPI000227A6BA|nr:permease-like cell division protein FtsX [Candidatus Arthromitus sp. SFB-rat-Yit]BAK80631.1 putative cell division protein FtsX [Candidatus Arthromitus sp. SFB-rat-Yit]
MKVSSFKGFTIDAIKSLFRNKTISIATIVNIVVTLTIYGVFLILMNVIVANVNDVESRLQLKVYLKDNITVEQQQQVKDAISGIEGIESVYYESKAEALVNFKNQLRDYAWMIEGYDENNNPLPSSYVVKIKSSSVSDRIEKALQGFEGIDDIGSDKVLVKEVSKISTFIRIAWIVLSFILILVSLFLIMNTIKLTIYSRRKEIYIMKFVGATDWFIRWPFVIEGIILGVIGSFISIGIIYYSYFYVYSFLNGRNLFSYLISPNVILIQLTIHFFLIGILVGIVGSIFSLRKFLKV